MAEEASSTILVLNSGSSTIKFKLYSAKDLTLVASGSIDALLSKQPAINVTVIKPSSSKIKNEALWDSPPTQEDINNYEVVFRAFLEKIRPHLVFDHVACIAHRVVHGGKLFDAPTILTDKVIEDLKTVSDLAPLHNPPALSLIHATRAIFSDKPQIAIFDTAFHRTMPEVAKTYALPYDKCLELGIAKYGFHGTSHGYLAKKTTAYLESVKPVTAIGAIKLPWRLVTLHLGNGASACAILDGKSVDTSMGLTPLEGLIMGTRSGDVDPSAIFHLSQPHFAEHTTLTDTIRVSQAEDILNHSSGLLGICGESDFRKIEPILSSNDSTSEKYRRCKLAVDMFTYRIAKYVASYVVPLKGIPHCIVFAGGVGENSKIVRRLVCELLDGLGVKLDDAKNEGVDGSADLVDISHADSIVKVVVVKADEEVIAALINSPYASNPVFQVKMIIGTVGFVSMVISVILGFTRLYHHRQPDQRPRRDPGVHPQPSKMMTRDTLRDRALAMIIQFLEVEDFELAVHALKQELGTELADDIQRISIGKPLLSLLAEAEDELKRGLGARTESSQPTSICETDALKKIQEPPTSPPSINQLYNFTPHFSNVLAVATINDNNGGELPLIVTSAADKSIRVSSLVGEPHLERILSSQSSPIINIVIHPTLPNVIITTSMGGDMSMIDILEDEELMTCRNHSKYVVAADIIETEEGGWVATGSYDKTVCIYRLHDGLPDLDSRIVLKHETQVEAVCFVKATHEHGLALVVACRDTNYLLYYYLSGNGQPKLVKYNMNANNDDWISFSVLHLATSESGPYLLASTSTPTGKLLLFLTHSSKILLSCYGAPAEVSLPRCCFSSDAKYLYVTGDDFAIWCFQVSTGELIRRITTHDAPVRCIYMDKQMNWVVSCGFDKQVYIHGQ
ncbi:acetate kinase [Synchytrium microbalum]|uniref:Probable acetate kinase n=1 Tax=Synchytrium microbalum TaxID=1806994 RepID=A0A507BZE9_9FUNG|nr:acetate kinase [Synchytrium microbalum]TPX31126.1 acetate kinase [Synchytrium microbalum]